MGNAVRKFLVNNAENSVFKFTIDTTLINPEGTDGSENPLTFRIPFRTTSNGNANTNCIVRVSDGRPDTSIVGNSESQSKGLLTFASSGIYEITIFGRVQTFGFYYRPPTAGYNGQDYRKIVSIDNWGSQIGYEIRCFYQCINLEIKATNTLVLPPFPSWFFQGIKGFADDSPLELIDTSRVSDNNANRMMSNITNPLKSLLNPFWQNLTTFSEVYANVTFDPSITKLEIISDTITSFSMPISNTMFRGRIEFKCPNVTSLFRIIWGYNNPPALGGIDIRNVTSCDTLTQSLMSKANVDATLLEWANDYDWSEIPDIPNKCNINFNGNTGACSCSATPEVLAAKTFLESKGYVFPYLTAV